MIKKNKFTNNHKFNQLCLILINLNKDGDYLINKNMELYLQLIIVYL